MLCPGAEAGMATHRVYPHDDLKQIVPGLWTVRGRLAFPLTRNMAVWRLPSKDLLLHSLVALDDHGLAALEALGRPAYAIVPHPHHQLDAPFYKARYPGIRVLTSARDRAAIAANVEVSGTVEDVLPLLGIRLHAVPGIKLTEYVYEILAAGGRALIVNDSFAGANLADRTSLFGRVFIAPFGVPGNRFGIARIFRMRNVSDIAALRRFAGELATIPDLNAITVAHGDPVLSDVAAALRRVASEA